MPIVFHMSRIMMDYIFLKKMLRYDMILAPVRQDDCVLKL